MYQSSVNSQVSSSQLLSDRPNRWEGQDGTEEWMGGTLSSKSIQSQDSWGLSEGKKKNINPNGEGGGCVCVQVLNHFSPLAIPEYFSSRIKEGEPDVLVSSLYIYILCEFYLSHKSC